MLRKIGVLLFMTIALVGCSKENDNNSNSMFVKEDTVVTLLILKLIDSKLNNVYKCRL